MLKVPLRNTELTRIIEAAAACWLTRAFEKGQFAPPGAIRDNHEVSGTSRKCLNSMRRRKTNTPLAPVPRSYAFLPLFFSFFFALGLFILVHMICRSAPVPSLPTCVLRKTRSITKRPQRPCFAVVCDALPCRSFLLHAAYVLTPKGVFIDATALFAPSL